MCPNCGSNHITPHGRTSAGSQRFKCRACGKAWTPVKKPRATLLGRPLTVAERARRWRERRKAQKSQES